MEQPGMGRNRHGGSVEVNEMKAQARKAWCCRTWTWTKLNGWTSEFARLDSEEDAEIYGKLHLKLRSTGELRDYEVIKTEA